METDTHGGARNLVKMSKDVVAARSAAVRRVPAGSVLSLTLIIEVSKWRDSDVLPYKWHHISGQVSPVCRFSPPPVMYGRRHIGGACAIPRIHRLHAHAYKAARYPATPSSRTPTPGELCRDFPIGSLRLSIDVYQRLSFSFAFDVSMHENNSSSFKS